MSDTTVGGAGNDVPVVAPAVAHTDENTYTTPPNLGINVTHVAETEEEEKARIAQETVPPPPPDTTTGGLG